MRIAHNWLVGKGQKKNCNKNYNVTSFLSTYIIAHLATFCMVLVPIGALDGTRGHAAVKQASISCCKGVHPYTHAIQHSKYSSIL